MRWSVKLKPGAAKAINKLDKPVRDRIKNFLAQLAETLMTNMRQYGYAY